MPLLVRHSYRKVMLPMAALVALFKSSDIGLIKGWSYRTETET